MRLVVLAFVLLAGCAADTLRLRHVVLYENGIGYFEREGVAEADPLRMPLPRREAGLRLLARASAPPPRLPFADLHAPPNGARPQEALQRWRSRKG